MCTSHIRTYTYRVESISRAERSLTVSSTYDSVGPMGKSSWDIAAMMDVIAPTESLPDQPQQSWMRFLTGAQSIHGESLRRLRIGVYAAPYEEGHGEERDNVVQQMTGPLSQLADEVNLVDHFEIPGVAKMNLEPLTVILPTDFYNEFKRYLEGVTGPIDSLEALNAWNSANPVGAFILAPLLFSWTRFGVGQTDSS